MNIIRKTPGISFRQAIRASGLPFGTAQFHLCGLEHKRAIRVTRTSGSTRYFDRTISRSDLQLLRIVKQKGLRQVIQVLLKGPSEGMPFHMIVSTIGKAPSTVSAHLRTLAVNRIVDVAALGSARSYALQRRKKLKEVLQRYKI
jgi:predicted transcriptional regulator